MSSTAVLLVEDSAVDARLATLRLEQSPGHRFSVEHVTRLSDALASALENEPDVVLLDLGLADSDGLATFSALRTALPEVAIVVLSSLDDEQAGLEAVRHGAQDFLVKGDVGGDALRRCVRYAVSRARAERALRREREYSQAILSSMSEGFSLTVDGMIVSVNDSLCKLTGFQRDELLGAKVPLPFWPPELAEQTSAKWAHLLGQDGGEVELTLMRKTGQRFPALVTLHPARSAAGALIGFASTLRDITESRHYEELLQRLASEDDLTGLANRRFFSERLQKEIARTKRRGGTLSLALLDLDHFKAVNDTYGHPIGDRVLVEVATRLRSALRAGDDVARLSGEEFGWLLPDCDAPAAWTAVERALRFVSAVPFAEVGTLTISAGICDLGDAGSAERLYSLADEALYEAKAAGRNRVHLYSGA